MYTLARTQKIKNFIVFLCILSFIFGIRGFITGSYPLLHIDSLDDCNLLIMFGFFAIGILLLLIILLIRAIQRDIADELKCLDQRKEEK